LRADQLSASLEKVQQTLQQAISKTVGETNRQLSALDGKLDAQGQLVDNIHASWRKLPELEAHTADLRNRLDEITSSAMVQLEEHLAHSQGKLEKHVFQQAQQAGQQVARALVALNSRTDVLEKEFATRLAETARRLEKELDEETRGAREILSRVLVDTHEDLSHLREVWVPSANCMAAEALKDDARYVAHEAPGAGVLRKPLSNQRVTSNVRKGRSR